MTQPAPLRVLYVEDDRVCALLLSQAMADEPRIAWRTAEDGAEALALAMAWKPAVLVLDAHLPDTSGHALLQRLRELPGLARVPAIMCSADETPQDLRRAALAGFAGYWVKPVAADRARADLLAIADDLNGNASQGMDDNLAR